jgi:ribosomal protein L16/L10AE
LLVLLGFVLMTRLKFGYSHRNFRKFHRIKRLCGRKGFTIFKPILSDIFLRLTGFGYLTFSSVEACRRVIRRGFKKQVYIFIKVFFFFFVNA